MPETALFVSRGLLSITPAVMENLLRQIPLLKAEFTQIRAPQEPHLFNQLEFLADLVEDFAEGADRTIPYVVVAAAAFALVYAHRRTDLIPDFLESGRRDDSVVVRSVLITYEAFLQRYATSIGVKWSTITTKP